MADFQFAFRWTEAGHINGEIRKSDTNITILLKSIAWKEMQTHDRFRTQRLRTEKLFLPPPPSPFLYIRVYGFYFTRITWELYVQDLFAGIKYIFCNILPHSIIGMSLCLFLSCGSTC